MYYYINPHTLRVSNVNNSTSDVWAQSADRLSIFSAGFGGKTFVELQDLCCQNSETLKIWFYIYDFRLISKMVVEWCLVKVDQLFKTCKSYLLPIFNK